MNAQRAEREPAPPGGAARGFFMPETTVILDAAAIQRALTRIAHEIAERNENSAEVVLDRHSAGRRTISRNGWRKILAGIWEHAVPIGILDVSHAPRRPGPARRARRFIPPSFPFDVTGKTVVLVDDVLFSGRTDARGDGRAERFWPAQKNPTGRAD